MPVGIQPRRRLARDPFVDRYTGEPVGRDTFTPVFESVIGGTLVAGAAIVAGVSIAQASRDPQSKSALVPVMVVPTVNLSGLSGKTAGLVVTGTF